MLDARHGTAGKSTIVVQGIVREALISSFIISFIEISGRA
jgi:hypothetical protein